MDWLINVLRSSIGKKVIMALTGLFLSFFLVSHLAGNFLLLLPDGGVTFNTYATFMSTTWYVRIAEIGLAAGFLFHIIDGVILTKANRKARPLPYEANRPAANSSWFSRNMALTGTMILLFLGLHLWTFFVQHRVIGIDETMYETARIHFKMAWYSGIYIMAFIILGMHLNHGFQSIFQSLGLNHSKYTPIIKTLGTLFAVGITVGYTIIPLFFLLGFDQ